MNATYIDTGAKFSLDGRYRVTLWRRWSDGPTLLVIGLNPSTADATTDDPTIRRCVNFARRWGYGCLEMRNLFALRATNPKALRTVADPGVLVNWPRLTAAVEEVGQSGGAVLAAWGDHGGYQLASTWFRLRLLATGVGVACLGLTKRDEPKHPLSLRADTVPVRYVGDGGRLVTAMAERKEARHADHA